MGAGSGVTCSVHPSGRHVPASAQRGLMDVDLGVGGRVRALLAPVSPPSDHVPRAVGDNAADRYLPGGGLCRSASAATAIFFFLCGGSMLSVILIGISLSMDAFAVSVTNGIAMRPFKTGYALCFWAVFRRVQFSYLSRVTFSAARCPAMSRPSART